MSLNSSIARAGVKECQVLATVGKQSFLESHGHSAQPKDIDQYVNQKYRDEVVKGELTDPKNIYHIIYHNDKPAGYSKIIYDCPHDRIGLKNVTELDRLYLLKEFYGLKLGFSLLQHNIELSKLKGQSGMWLFTWKENKPAIDFYTKAGFRIIGSHDFKLTEMHSNPNHHMFLEY